MRVLKINVAAIMTTSLTHHVSINHLTVCNRDLGVLMARSFYCRLLSAVVLCLILMPHKITHTWFLHRTNMCSDVLIDWFEGVVTNETGLSLHKVTYLGL